MNKIVLIPDSFKGTMSSGEICEIMTRAIHKAYPQAQVVSIPVADGGEGSVDCFLNAVGGTRAEVASHNPFMEPIASNYGLLFGGTTAVIEMAACAGLPMVEGRKNPLTATTYGVGEQIADALGRGVKELVVGLGGSATNDGGCGAACAVGVKFFDSDGNSFVPAGGTLCNIARIDVTGRLPALSNMKITAMCDIDNPMHGERGAAYIFGPQKGANPETVRQLDDGLRHLAQVIHKDLGLDLAQMPGAGAAGAMGAGMVAFFGATLQMGIETVLDTVKFDQVINGADLIFTGEGRMDSQSLSGKVVIGVARRAKPHGVPVVAVVGDVLDPVDAAYDQGVTAIFPTNRLARDFSETRSKAPFFLECTMTDVVKLCKALVP